MRVIEADLDADVGQDAEAGSADARNPGLGIRRGLRGGDERRSRGRRRIRIFLFAAATAGILIAVKGPAVLGLFPGVSVSVNQFRAVPADRAYDVLISEAARTYSVDEDLIRAVIRAESSFDPLQVSPAGAKGLMQIMPVLAKELGITDPFDPRQNIMAGARYLRRLLDSHSGNIALTLASYNAGPATVRRYKGMPPFRETRNYVKKIKGYLAEADTTDTD
jgi:soluble lytic murein transglycosylase-like protein